jgi:Cof subfamily protein (haloacid dehalogenase superfamily)
MFFPSPKGIIALDIDGTLTDDDQELDARTIDALQQLIQEEWKLIFITGRPFQWGFRTLHRLPFPYALAVQNGALLVDMPTQTILDRRYLSQGILPLFESICQKQQTDFVIYSGLENEDWCYYRPSHLPSPILSYVLQRTADLGEKWQALADFSHVPVSTFSSIKCFAQEEQAYRLSEAIEAELGLHAPPNRDPYDRTYFVIQATHAEATKGDILRTFAQLMNVTSPIIAAGDDYNDRTMLQQADIKVVMANAPAELLALADVIAPPASQQGIIQGLAEAMKRLAHKKREAHD